ncbi:MAG: hybrid sensor histidine kinase/response regulator [Candidatus Competibacteraceae bacterium]|nr:MAG: hybrid sensor histidine kinase/response regulator [Candidatus Competibacteraceae bacterium]
MISRRVADNPLGAIKDDLLLALRRIQLDLDAYCEDPTQPAQLETMVDAIEQIRSPLAVLEHREAVALLEEMRTGALECMDSGRQSLEPELVRQAIRRLAAYLEGGLDPGSRRPNEELSEIATVLRQGRLRDSQVNAKGLAGGLEEPVSAVHVMQETLKRLRQTVTAKLETAPDRPESWMALQDDLQSLLPMLAEKSWAQAFQSLSRLDRIVGALAEGAAEYYGLLVNSVCAEVLAGLNYYLESQHSGGSASAVVMRKADEHLAQIETLLNLPHWIDEPVVAAPSAAARPTPSAAATNANSAPNPFDATLDLELAAWSEQMLTDGERPKTVTAATDELAIEWPQPTDASSSMTTSAATAADELAIEWPQPTDALPPANVPAVEPPVAKPPAEVGPDLVNLIGLADADPEFVDVFLEEARGELVTIREQLALWQADPQDRQALTTLRRAFHTLKGSGRMVGAVVIGDFAWEFENLLNQVLEGGLNATPVLFSSIASAVTALGPLVGETPLQGGELEKLGALAVRARALPKTEPDLVSTRPPAMTIAAEIDPEFVEVFFEEARGELATIREQLAIWQANPQERQALVTMRRAFHTLKGSGRVVGATAIGDFAAYFEKLLSRTLDGSLAMSRPIAGAIGDAAAVLEPLVGEISASADAVAALPRLTARVDALLRESPAPVESIKPVELIEEEVVESIEPEPVVADEQPAPVVEPVAEDEPVQPVEPVLTEMPVIPPPPMEAPALLAAADLELVQAFQYEAAEILDASDTILQGLSAEPEQTGLLNDLRRNMHTLKGSSRMAGIMTVGDLAHAAESILDALGKGLGQVTPVVLDALQQTLDRLNRMLTDAAAGMSLAAATDLIGELHRLADAVTKGESVEKVAPAATPTGASEPATSATEPVFQPMTELDQELVQVFQAEAAEILDSSDAILQRLRSDPSNIELLNNLRREMHTLKGSSRMAGIMTVGDLAHAAESVLDALGKGVLPATPLTLDYVQRALDALHPMLAALVERQRPEARQDLIDELHGVLGVKPVERAKPAAPTLVATVPTAAARPVEMPTVAATDQIRVSAALLNTLVNQMGESSIFRARVDQGVSLINFGLNELEQTISRLRRQVTQLATQAEARIQSRQDHGTKAHQLEFDPLELDRFTELQQVSRSLMEIADDLGNIGNTMGEHAREITTLLDQQGKVNKEIQQGLMRTGMVRFGSIIPRLRRVIRQSAQELGKRAELLVGGDEAEVDRTVLENMIAPLEHMLRNSLAHGIEAPERRREVGKSDIGTISLSLRREGAELVLELGDDGAGLNFDAIRAKGTEKGLLLPGQPATQEELIALLLRPGFSTANAVTQIAGRGVGMDVVNAAIRSMRGALLIQTEPGQGTRFIVRLPFSLSVTQALLVQAGDATFAIPLLSIEVVTRLKENEFQSYLGGEQIRHQYGERHYPIHNLGILMGSEQMLPFEETKDRRPPALLFRSAEASAALQVEAVLGNQEIIVKPISPQFNGVPGISGATVLGDGRVVVVLELAAVVRNVGSQRQKQAESRVLRVARQEVRPEKINIMVIDDSITMRKVTARILERHNIQVVTAKDGLDAVAMLQTQVPDLAILDIEMPRMDGFEVVAHVRNQAHMKHLPIIMVTSRGGEKHRERAMRLGVNEYLTKPYQEDQLMQSIRKILGEQALGLIT